MTKKVLILSLNYSSTPAIALSGRINIAVNARGVFIADYGILEENIKYLSDEWTPLTKAQIRAAIQALVDESTSLEEIYIYYAGYGSGIQIVKSIDWALMPQPDTNVSLPVDNSTITISIDELEPTTTEPVVPTIDPVIPPVVPAIDPLIPSFIVFPEPPIPPPPYKYDFYPMTQSYDKLTKQMVGSDYEIITNSEILDMLKNSKCRTICVLDMCPLVDRMTEPLTNEVPLVVGTTEPMANEVPSVGGTLTWGTDIIGNVNIISFAEPDSISSGKLATIQVITQHIRG
uniref:Caspase family protein n=1 Tax=viral metagenome TaxID=1070528 RepID=A0A6C0B637_9ZZZZ